MRKGSVIAPPANVGSIFSALFGSDQYKPELSMVDNPSWEQYVPYPTDQMDCATILENQATALAYASNWRMLSIKPLTNPYAAIRASQIAKNFQAKYEQYKPYADKCTADLLAGGSGEGGTAQPGSTATNSGDGHGKTIAIVLLAAAGIMYAKKKKWIKF